MKINVNDDGRVEAHEYPFDELPSGSFVTISPYNYVVLGYKRMLNKKYIIVSRLFGDIWTCLSKDIEERK